MTAAALLSDVAAASLVFAVFYFAIVLPERREIAEAAAAAMSLGAGDRVLVAGSVLGEIRETGPGPVVLVELAPGVCVACLRSGLRAAPAADGPPQSSGVSDATP